MSKDSKDGNLTPERKRNPEEDENDRVNPFERCRLNNLQHQFWSPTIFQNVNMGETPPQSNWTLHQQATLFPKPIEHSPSSHMNEYPIDLAMEAKAQADIDKFFSSGLIAPSPDEAGPRKKGILYKTDESTNTPKLQACTMTELRLPTTLPSHLNALLAPFMQTEISCGSEPFEPSSIKTKNDSRDFQNVSQTFSSLRRRLELSFGDTIPQEDPEELITNSTIELPYGDPFGRNHKMISPVAHSSKRMNSHSSSISSDSKVLFRCEFTPGLGVENRDITMSSPELTPIRNATALGPQDHVTSLSASEPTTPLSSWNYDRVENQDNRVTPTSTEELKVDIYGKTDFHRREITKVINSMNPVSDMNGLSMSQECQNYELEIGDTSSNEPHRALINRIVLLNIFERLDFLSLRSSRLVCKAWHESTLFPFRNKSMFTPMKYENIVHLKEMTSKSCPVPRLQDICLGKFSSGCSRLPYANACVTKYVADPKGMKESVFDSWFTDWGKDLKAIRFDWFRTNILRPYKSISLSKVLTEWCPALEELEFRHSTDTLAEELNLKEGQLPNVKRIFFRDNMRCLSEDQGKRFPEVEKLLKATSNLEFMDVFMQNSIFTYSVVSFITMYAKKLHTLTWNKVLTDRDLRLFANTPGVMCLKELRLNCTLFPYSSTAKDLFKFLSRSAKTLEIFHLRGTIEESYDETDSEEEEDIINLGFERNRYQHFLTLDLPIMEKLVELELKDIFHCRFSSFDFVLKLPNLQKLLMRNVAYASNVRPFKPDQLFESLLNPSMELLSKPHTKLRELNLRGEILNPDFVKLLSKCFPNLKVADLFVNSGTVFLKVFQEFQGLEELKLRFNPAIVPNFCDAALIRFLPNLKDLKKLLLVNGGKHPFLLTEFMAEESFETMTHIQRLEFVNFSIKQEEYENIMGRLKLHELVIFKNCIVQKLKSCNVTFIKGIPSNSTST